MLFPLLANIEDAVASKMSSRAGKNDVASKLTSWIRVASAANDEGFVMESLPPSDSFNDRYGFNKNNDSGRIGQTFAGKSISVDVTDRKGRPSPIIEGLTIEFINDGNYNETIIKPVKITSGINGLIVNGTWMSIDDYFLDKPLLSSEKNNYNFELKKITNLRILN